MGRNAGRAQPSPAGPTLADTFSTDRTRHAAAWRRGKNGTFILFNSLPIAKRDVDKDDWTVIAPIGRSRTPTLRRPAPARDRQRGDAVCLRPVGVRRRGLAAVSPLRSEEAPYKASRQAQSRNRALAAHRRRYLPAGLSDGAEGVVSKRLFSPYRSGRSTDWLKIKDPESPAMIRGREAEW
jgi:hypothetical protein